MTTFRNPFAGHWPVTLKFGSQLPPKFGGGISTATDFGVPSGTSILASAEGIVTSTKQNYGGGNVVEILHDNGISSTYAHLNNWTVRPGEKVKAGQQIGISGNTGAYTTGPHLLFGLKQNGQNIDPEKVLMLNNVDLPFFGAGDEIAAKIKSDLNVPDQGFLGIPGAIGDAAFTFGFIFLGAIVLLAGVLLMRSKND